MCILRSCAGVLVRLFVVGFAVIALTGCGPSTLLQLPENWPTEWEGRKLYNTPNSFIYASRPDLAGEADQIARTVGDAFLRQTGSPAPKGLLIVSDEKDPQLIQDEKTWFDLLTLGKKLSAGEDTPTPEELDRQWRKMEETNQSLNIPSDTQLKMLPIQFDRESFSSALSFPGGMPSEIQWSVVIPSRKVVQHCNQTIIDAQLEKEGIGILARTAMAPILALALTTAEETCIVTQRVAVFARCTVIQGEQCGWSEETIHKTIKEYADREIEGVLGALKRAPHPDEENTNNDDSAQQEPPEKT